MLSKLENKVMYAIYNKCRNKSSVLINKSSLIRLAGEGEKAEQKLDEIVKDLYTDGYFDLVYTERQGEKVYCITLTEKGKGFPRVAKVVRRTLAFKLVVTVGFAVLSFVLGLILKAIFS